MVCPGRASCILRFRNPAKVLTSAVSYSRPCAGLVQPTGCVSAEGAATNGPDQDAPNWTPRIERICLLPNVQCVLKFELCQMRIVAALNVNWHLTTRIGMASAN